MNKIRNTLVLGVALILSYSQLASAQSANLFQEQEVISVKAMHGVMMAVDAASIGALYINGKNSGVKSAKAKAAAELAQEGENAKKANRLYNATKSELAEATKARDAARKSVQSAKESQVASSTVAELEANKVRLEVKVSKLTALEKSQLISKNKIVAKYEGQLKGLADLELRNMKNAPSVGSKAAKLFRRGFIAFFTIDLMTRLSDVAIDQYDLLNNEGEETFKLFPISQDLKDGWNLLTSIEKQDVLDAVGNLNSTNK